jgi:hypothetical protein
MAQITLPPVDRVLEKLQALRGSQQQQGQGQQEQQGRRVGSAGPQGANAQQQQQPDRSTVEQTYQAIQQAAAESGDTVIWGS